MEGSADAEALGLAILLDGDFLLQSGDFDVTRAIHDVAPS